MNPQGTSFIPQRPTQGRLKNRGVRKIYILAYVSYVFFFGTTLAAAGLFFYNATLEAKLVHQKELLTAERDKFSQSDIESVRELERRINLAKERMDAHISVVSIFEALEKNAVQSLQLVSFGYKRLNDDAPVVTVSGNTNEFNKVLFQRDVLNADPILAGGVFSEVTLGSPDNSIKATDGSNEEVIRFIFTKAVTPSLVGYVPRNTGASSNDTQNNTAEVSAPQENAPQAGEQQQNDAPTGNTSGDNGNAQSNDGGNQ